MNDLTFERMQTALYTLKLQQIPNCLDHLADEATSKNWTYIEFLDQLLQAEMRGRSERDVALKTRMAHFPFVKTLDQFDFNFQPSVNEKQVRELATMRFVAHGENLLLLGPPGVGKTHLAVALGMSAIQQGLSVQFLSVADLLEQIARDAKADRLNQRLQLLGRPKLLIIDEMGYFPLDYRAGQFLFQLVSRRYQQQILCRLGRYFHRSHSRHRTFRPTATCFAYPQYSRTELPPQRQTQVWCFF